MQLITALIFFSLTLVTVAEPRRAHRRSSVRVQSTRGTTSSGTKEKTLAASSVSGESFAFDHNKYSGEYFLNEWNFFTNSDPTHGLVDYKSKDFATKNGLAYVKGNQTTLAVDDKTSLPKNANRDSVRIETQKTYSGGLFTADFQSTPTGCGTWPAYWSVGPKWPTGGEIDILEGVNDQGPNQYTLHTSGGCTLSNKNMKISGKKLGEKCASSGRDNSGCAYKDTDGRTYREAFNTAGGGVFVHQWDSAGIKVWHFARDDVPEDIKAQAGQEQKGQKLNPSKWGEPAAFWNTDTCDMGTHFKDHKLVINTTLCGDWAGNAYGSSQCPGSCVERVMSPENFDNAKWKINYIAVYQ